MGEREGRRGRSLSLDSGREVEDRGTKKLTGFSRFVAFAGFAEERDREGERTQRRASRREGVGFHSKILSALILNYYSSIFKLITKILSALMNYEVALAHKIGLIIMCVCSTSRHPSFLLIFNT